MRSAKKSVRGTKPGATHVTGPGGLDAKGFARWYRERTLEQWRLLDLDALARLAAVVERAQARGRFVWVCGNGGSAATAAHVGCDFGKTAAVKGAKPLKAVSLSDNAAFLTAVANDLSFDETFSRQLENVAAPGDVVILISGSGNSPNLVAAARLARRRGAAVVGLLGFDGGRLKALCDEVLLIPSDQYGVIEDLHMSVAHILTFYLKQKRA
ncbi:MAG: SIS domain-containing protein [Elusimicrobia bacterium]|nr:SIS domain-containing protein [Elusimicrobiota bacterium]